MRPYKNTNIEPQAGDIVACWGVDLLSRFISAITSSVLSPPSLMFSPSHVAIISELDQFPSGQLFWVESTTLASNACVYRNKVVKGVQAHYIHQREVDYLIDGGKIRVYRPTIGNELDEERIDSLSFMASTYLENETDYDTISAIISGTRFTSHFLSLFGVADEDLFCSDFLAKLLKPLGLLDKHKPSYIYSPGRLMRELVKSGTYRRIV